MRLHRFYIENAGFADAKVGDTIVLDKNRHESTIHQMVNVFRYKVGQEILVFDGSGLEYSAKIESIDKKIGITLELTDKMSALNQREVLGNNVILCFSLIKKDNIELILQKCTELGVSEFYPLISERSEKKGFNKERAEKIIIEAVEQSGWTTLPVLHEVMDLDEVIQKTKDAKQIMFHTSSLSPSSKRREEDASVALFVGPEGGWSDSEIELFKKSNFESQSLGKQTLRAETAAIVAVGKYI